MSEGGALLAVEHAVLIAVGLLFWWPVLCDVPRSLPTLGRIGYVLAAFVLSAFLGLAHTFRSGENTAAIRIISRGE